LAGRRDDLAGYQERPRIIQVGSYRFILALPTQHADPSTGELTVAPRSPDTAAVP
jgi:hypothetical protein